MDRILFCSPRRLPLEKRRLAISDMSVSNFGAATKDCDSVCIKCTVSVCYVWLYKMWLEISLSLLLRGERRPGRSMDRVTWLIYLIYGRMLTSIDIDTRYMDSNTMIALTVLMDNQDLRSGGRGWVKWSCVLTATVAVDVFLSEKKYRLLLVVFDRGLFVLYHEKQMKCFCTIRELVFICFPKLHIATLSMIQKLLGFEHELRIALAKVYTPEYTEYI